MSENRESDIENYAVRCTKRAHGEIRKCGWIGRHSAPDRRVMLPYRKPFWVEFKAPGEEATEAQKREHNRMRDFGEEVYVVDSKNKVDELWGIC